MKWYAIKLVLLCVIIFSFQTPWVIDNFALHQEKVLAEPWMLITSIFLHAGLKHLFYNMFALALFGSILEKIIGSRKFLLVFFFSGLTASVAAVFFYPVSLGASGAIFGIIGALTVLRPKMVAWVYGVPMYMFIAAILWTGINLMGIFYPSNIACAAHLAGMGSGLAFGFYYRKFFKVKSKKREKSNISEQELDEWERRYMHI